MKRFFAYFIATLILFSSCERGETEGILDNEVAKEELLGGWKITSIEFQLVYNAANPLAWMMPTLKKKMQENLSEKIQYGSIYFMQDTVFYIIDDPEDSTQTRVHAYGAYTITSHPAVLHPENPHLICNAYAEYFYIKNEDGQMSFYLTKPGVIALLKDDGSLSSSTVNLIDNNIDDAQFYLYLNRNNLPFYQEIERQFGGDTISSL